MQLANEQTVEPRPVYYELFELIVIEIDELEDSYMKLYRKIQDSFTKGCPEAEREAALTYAFRVRTG